MTTELTVARHDETLAVAARLFAARGYNGVGVDEIGEAVGATGPALYRYFPNKQAILDTVCLEFGERVLDRTREAVSLGGTPKHTLERLVQMRADVAFRTEGLVFVIFHAEARNLSEQARGRYAAMTELYRAEWLRLLAQLRPQASTTELHVAFHAVHNLIGYTAFQEQAIDEEVLKPHLARMAVAVLLA
jgi:AcrR family transcriptional regulator